MLISSIGRTAYRSKLADLETFNYVTWQRGNSNKERSYICITPISPNGIVTISANDTVKETISANDIVTLPPNGIGKEHTMSANDTDLGKTLPPNDIVLNTVYREEKSFDNSVNNITNSLKEKKIRTRASASVRGVAQRGTSFEDSEIGTLESFTDYLKNESAYPQANQNYYFEAVRDW